MIAYITSMANNVFERYHGAEVEVSFPGRPFIEFTNWESLITTWDAHWCEGDTVHGIITRNSGKILGVQNKVQSEITLMEVRLWIGLPKFFFLRLFVQSFDITDSRDSNTGVFLPKVVERVKIVATDGVEAVLSIAPMNKRYSFSSKDEWMIIELVSRLNYSCH